MLWIRNSCRPQLGSSSTSTGLECSHLVVLRSPMGWSLGKGGAQEGSPHRLWGVERALHSTSTTVGVGTDAGSAGTVGNGPMWPLQMAVSGWSDLYHGAGHECCMQFYTLALGSHSVSPGPLCLCSRQGNIDPHLQWKERQRICSHIFRNHNAVFVLEIQRDLCHILRSWLFCALRPRPPRPGTAWLAWALPISSVPLGNTLKWSLIPGFSLL